MAERVPWLCKSCGAVLGWQSGESLEVNPEALERFTLPSLVEEIWVTCRQCRAVQVWRARAGRPAAAGGRWRAKESPAEEDRGDPPPRRGL